MLATTIIGQNHCALHTFHAKDSKKHARSDYDRMIEDPNARDDIVFCSFHSFLVEVQTNAGYIHATHT